jgi:hypothetical protein
MSGKDWMKPTERGKRDPLSNDKTNGAFENPPRYAELGGFKSSRIGHHRNKMTVRRPGGTNA